MFEKRDSEAVRPRQYKALQGKYERLQKEHDELVAEKAALDEELRKCKDKLDAVAGTQAELADIIQQTRHIKEQYEQAYDELKTIRSKYSAEVTKLIKQMKH